MNNETPTKSQQALLSQDFASVLQIIEQNRSQAVQAINHASVLTAWQVGAFVSVRIKNASWGSKVVQQLAEYIHTQNPILKGWSKRTIYKMVQFYETFTTEQFIARASYLKLLPEIEPKGIVSTPLMQNGHNIIVSPAVAQMSRSNVIMPPAVAKNEEQLKVGSVLQRSLEEFVGFISDK